MKALVLALGLAIPLAWSSLAQAQATRTWVSGVGDDANPCSRTAPCKTFAGAISKTAAAGEINCIDPGGFGALTITKSIAIICDNVEAGVLVSGTNGIVINAAPTDVVYLSGLDFEGVGTSLNGISFLQGAALHVVKSVIRGFTAAAPNGNAILFAPSAGTAELYVDDTILADNGVVGIEVRPTGSGSATASISRVRSENNSTGFRLNGTTTSGSLNMNVENSVASGNSGAGFNVTAGTSPSAQMMLTRSSAVENANGLHVDGANARLRFGYSVVTGNAIGTSASNGGVFASYGNNQIDGNTSDGPNPPTIPLK